MFGFHPLCLRVWCVLSGSEVVSWASSLGTGSKPWSLSSSAIAPEFFHQSSLLPRAGGRFSSHGHLFFRLGFILMIRDSCFELLHVTGVTSLWSFSFRHQISQAGLYLLKQLLTPIFSQSWFLAGFSLSYVESRCPYSLLQSRLDFGTELFGSALCVLEFFISQSVLCFPCSDPLCVLCFGPVLDQHAGRCCSLPTCSSPSVPGLILLVDLPVSAVLALSLFWFLPASTWSGLASVFGRVLRRSLGLAYSSQSSQD
jgi:hypothetical protein